MKCLDFKIIDFYLQLCLQFKRSVIDTNITSFKCFQGTETLAGNEGLTLSESLNNWRSPSHLSQQQLTLLLKQVHFSSSCWDCYRSWGQDWKQDHNWAVGGLLISLSDELAEDKGPRLSKCRKQCTCLEASLILNRVGKKVWRSGS